MNRQIALNALIVLLFPNILMGQMVVSDPAALAQSKLNYVEAINTVSQLRESVATAKQQINKTEEMRDAFSMMRTEMSTVYNNTFGLIGELERLRQDIASTPNELMKMMEELKANANCLFSDLDKYSQVETMYKARYVFKDEYGGTPNNPDDDPYIWRNNQDMAGSFVPVQLQENPCGHTVTYFSQIKAKYEEERSVIERVLAKYNQSREEITANAKFYEEMEEKIQETKTEKETLDTMKTVLWKMNSHLESIDKTLLDVARIYISSFHDPTALSRAPGLSPTSLAMIQSEGISLGEANEFEKRAAVWKSLGSSSKNPLLK